MITSLYYLYYLLYILIALMIIIACAFVIKRPLDKTVFLSGIFIILFSLGLYHFIGNAEIYREYLYQVKINQLIIKIQAHLQQDPESQEGWYLLGKLYLSQNRIQEAEQAFVRAKSLKVKSVQ